MKPTKSQFKIEKNLQYKWAKDDFEVESKIEDLISYTMVQIKLLIDEFYTNNADEDKLHRKSVTKTGLGGESKVETLKQDILRKLKNTNNQVMILIVNHLINSFIIEHNRQGDLLEVQLEKVVPDPTKEVEPYFKSRKGYSTKQRIALAVFLTGMYVDIRSYRKKRDEFLRNIEILKNNSLSLLRTKASEMRADAQKDAFKQAGVEYYYFSSEADSSVCSICASLHGKRFLVSEMEKGVNCQPMHPNCRCSCISESGRKL